MVESSDSGDKPIKPHERRGLSAKDVLAAMNASGEDLREVAAQNPNAVDGSATPKQFSRTPEGVKQIEKQDDSIVIVDEEKGIFASRTIPIKESSFSHVGERRKDEKKACLGGVNEAASIVAYDLKDAQRDLNSSLKKVGTSIECSQKTLSSFEKPASLDAFHPHAGREDDFVSYPACSAANAEFPELKKRIGTGDGHIDKDLIAATIRLEVAYYKQGVDTGQDRYILERGVDDGIGQKTSIGPAQMQIRHINRLVTQFPWQLGHFAKDPLRAALIPENAPHFVGGYFVDVIQHINKGTKPDFIESKDWDGVKKFWRDGDLNAALIYSYNPTKEHIDSVKRQLKIIRERH